MKNKDHSFNYIIDDRAHVVSLNQHREEISAKETSRIYELGSSRNYHG